MAKRNRSTLKNYFRPGAMPCAEHFADLIDSSVNQLEEGFDKPATTGLQLTALDQQHLLSFYQQNIPDQSLWHIGFAKQQTALQFVAERSAQDDEEKVCLTLTTDAKVGLNNPKPNYELDVNGTVAAKGRRGGLLLEAQIPADGQWHDITPELEGCQMFEIVAGVGIRHSGRYALMHAIAINTCAPRQWWSLWQKKNPIEIQQGYFRSRADKLRLRWKQSVEHGAIRPYVLQIRSNTSYGEDKVIRYHITQLWHDDYMQECQSTPSPKDDE